MERPRDFQKGTRPHKHPPIFEDGIDCVSLDSYQIFLIVSSLFPVLLNQK